MCSSDRDGIEANFAALQAAVTRLLGHSFGAVTTPDRVTYLARLEQETRRLHAPGHLLINQLAEQAGRDELGARLPTHWPIGCTSPPVRPPGVSPKPPSWARAAR